jgi:hypothetical protein
MKEMIEDVSGTGQGCGGRPSFSSCHLRTERGVVLVMVIVLSAVALLIMTTLIYMITTGTQVSGLQKRYKTALEAGAGGGDVFYQLIALRGETAGTNAFTANLNAFNLNSAVTTAANCTGVLSGATYTGWAAKLITPSTSWDSVNCDSSIHIDPNTPTSYDMKIELGATTKYTVYAKIVATTQGNTGGDTSLQTKGVVSANTGEVAVMAISYIYAIEAVSENSARNDERAKLSIVYQY